jgi:glycosyltransferase involved in cell wall biosynthesis
MPSAPSSAWSPDAPRFHAGFRSKLSVVNQTVDVSPAAVRADKTPPETEGRVRCVLVGQLHPGKGQEDAILAIGVLARERIPASLVLVGDGKKEHRESLIALVTRSNLGGRVMFVGHVENPRPHFQEADVVLVCSRSEAFGRVTVEGMKLGKPIIGTRSGGTPELVVEGETGLLYTPGNFRELAEKICLLRSHPEMARAMGREGRRLAEARFSEDRYPAFRNFWKGQFGISDSRRPVVRRRPTGPCRGGGGVVSGGGIAGSGR